MDREAYLLTLCRYVGRDPVAAAPGEWPWSSCRAHVGRAEALLWLDSDGLHSYLIGEPVASAAYRRRAVRVYAKLVCHIACGQ